MTRFAVLAGTLGVGIGFGLQNVVNNFVSGLILLYEQPVQVGDVIELGQLSGEVRRIGVRSSTVRTGQGADVIVPNSNFISAEVVNWTGSDRSRRVDTSWEWPPAPSQAAWSSFSSDREELYRRGSGTRARRALHPLAG